MCGIAGGRFEVFDWPSLYAVVELAELTTLRGRDGFGLVAIGLPVGREPGGLQRGFPLPDEEPQTVLGDGDIRVIVEHRRLVFDRSELMNDLVRLLGCREVLLVMSSRAQPLPEAESTLARLQPYVGRKFALVHNGTISNDRDLWNELVERGYETGEHPGVDTMVVHRAMEATSDLPEHALVGGYAFAWISAQGHRLELAKNVKTLWVARAPGLDAFASEPEWLTKALNAGRLSWPVLEQLPPYSRWSPGETIREVKGKWWASTPDLDDDKAVVVTSGGIDSITAAWVAVKVHGKQVTLVNCPHGQLAQEAEWSAVQACAERLGVEAVRIEMPWLGALGASPLTDASIELPLGMRSAESTLCWTPARNLVMLSACAAVAEARGAKWLYYGNNMEEEATAYGDNDLDFVNVMNVALQYGTLKGVQIRRALARLMKPEILVVGDELGVRYDLTWSCDRGLLREHPERMVGVAGHPDFDTIVGRRNRFVACGECGCCTTRRYAFKRAGLVDPQDYVYRLDASYPVTTARSYVFDELVRRLA